MATIFSIYLLFTLYYITFSTFYSTVSGIFCEEISEGIAIKRVEKRSHLHFYFHDVISGKKPSAVKIAGPPNSSAYGFGATMMMDDALTEGPEISSKLVGRAQGMYALAAQEDVSLLMVMNLAFIEGTYNGSSISVVGRNPVFDDVREMPIVGGSGVFRFDYCLNREARRGSFFSTSSYRDEPELSSFENRRSGTFVVPRTDNVDVLTNSPRPDQPTIYACLLCVRSYHGVVGGRLVNLLERVTKTSTISLVIELTYGRERDLIFPKIPISCVLQTLSCKFALMFSAVIVPTISSKLVGRAQWMYALAAQEDVSLLMVMNLAFTEGTYNGSSISVVGRNPVFDDVREMPIVGGSGVFRFGRGYALAHTIWFDYNTGDATVEYNVYVSHY
ncbi:hypothetical protein GOBAR_DD29662 [Gossypium barbadense]|nr:hypothetical protein GOBAR_DD29662 [Gossypium barbadense]